MKYIIDDKLLQTLGNYLMKKPFEEVYSLINAVQQLQPYKENEQISSDSKQDTK